MTETILIPRDQPLEPRRTLRFTFTISYDVPVDDDLLQGEPAASLQEIEDSLSGVGDDTYGLWRSLHENYDRQVVDHEVDLADVNKSLEDAPTPGLPYEQRFESKWERDERIQGNAEAVWFRSRRWLDAIPASNVGASA